MALKNIKSNFALLSVLVSWVFLLSLTRCKNGNENISPLTNSWEIAVPHQETPKGLSSMNAKECGVCHKQHYDEWKLSTHAHAWTDMQFQSELKKESSPFMCINCHIPLQNQQEFIVVGLIDGDIYKPVKKKNPKFNKSLQQEGITCVSCHMRNNAIIGTTGTTNAPHKTIKDSKFLSEQLCISCHNASAVITPTLACTFETGDEWKAGPYPGKKNCISCHMESTMRENAPGFGIKKSHSHYFAGSGIPKIDSVQTKMLNGLGIYPSILKSSYSKNDSLFFTLKVKNEFAGHKVPTGDPERFFKILFELKNKTGDLIAIKTERIGEQWEWYPEAKKISDNNLYPNEERVFNFSHLLKEEGQLILTVTITKHRLNQAAANYNKLEENYPLFISIFNKAYIFDVK